MSRIDPLADAGDSQDLKSVFQQLLATRQQIPSMYGILAHHPEILKAHRAYFHAALDSGQLDRALKERIAYRVAVISGSAYSSASHRRYALAHGVDAEELDAIAGGVYAGLTERDRVALSLADEAVSSSTVSDARFADMLEYFSSSEIVEISALIGLMVLASTVGAIFGLEPDTGPTDSDELGSSRRL